MRMEQAGLLRAFQNGRSDDPTYCLRKINQETNNNNVKDVRKPLTLKGLSGAFVVLGVGYALAVLFFLLEKVYFNYQKRKIHHLESQKVIGNAAKIIVVIIQKPRTLAVVAPAVAAAEPQGPPKPIVIAASNKKK